MVHWFADGRRIASTAERTISFDGTGYEGRTVEIRVEARTKSRFVSASALSLEVLPPGGADGDLRVLLEPDITEAAAGTPLRFSGTAFPRKGGGTLKYQWSVNGEFAGDGDALHFDTVPWEGKTAEIVFYAAQVSTGRCSSRDRRPGKSRSSRRSRCPWRWNPTRRRWAIPKRFGSP